MKCRLFAPIAAILRAVHAPGTLPPMPCEMKRALASIEHLDRVADEKIARVKARNREMGLVVDDLVSHR